MPQSFEIVEPTFETPVLVEVPHAGLSVDPESLATMIAPARSLARDSDLYVDDLFRDAPKAGATLLCARMSRYVIDLNRSEDDVDSGSVEGARGQGFPRGSIWRVTTEGQSVLNSPIPRAEYERRLRQYYRPYHRAITEILRRKRERFGFAILLCAHSMPSQGRSGHPDQRVVRADLVPGTRGRTSSASVLIDEVDNKATEVGWTVRHDDPYRGGFTTAHYGRPHEGLHAIQLEVARRLYMNEQTLKPDAEGFESVRRFAVRLVSTFVSYQDKPERTALSAQVLG